MAAAKSALFRWPDESSRTERPASSASPNVSRARSPAADGLAAKAADETQNVPQRGVRRDIRELREIGQSPSGFGFFPPEIGAVDEDAARVRTLDARGQLEQRALAAAVRAEEQGQTRRQREARLPDDGPLRLVTEGDGFEDHHEALQERGSPAFRWWRSAHRVGLNRRSAFRAKRKATGAATARSHEIHGITATLMEMIVPSTKTGPRTPNGRSAASRMAPAPRRANQAKGPTRNATSHAGRPRRASPAPRAGR